MSFCRKYEYLLTCLLLTFCFHSAEAQNQKSGFNYFSGDTAYTQKTTEKGSPLILKTNPFTMLMAPIPIAAEYRISAEFMVKTKQSAEIGLSYLGEGLLVYIYSLHYQALYGINISKELKVYGGRLQLGYKFYLVPQYSGLKGDILPYGLYIAPHFSFSYAELHDEKNKDVYLTFQHSNIVAMLGYNLDFGANWNMDLFCGMGYKWNLWEEIDNSKKQQKTTITPKNQMGIYGFPVKIYAGFNVGYAFR